MVYRGASTATGDGWCRHEYGFDVVDRERGESRTFEGGYDMRFWGELVLAALLREAGFEWVRLEASEGYLLTRAEPA